MTFHADAFIPERDPCTESPAPESRRTLDDECCARLSAFHGGATRDVRIRHALYGAEGAPVVVVQGGISANRYAGAVGGNAGWWEDVVGPDRAIDTRRYRVLSIEWLDRTDFEAAASHPGACRAIGSEDQADAIAAVLVELGIRDVHA